MARPRILSDDVIFVAILRLVAAQGDRAVAFSSVARATGLAASTLVQRFGGRDAMLRAALGYWLDRLEALIVQVEPDAPYSAKGAAVFLKALGNADELGPPAQLLAVILRDPVLRSRALDLRNRIEAVLALRFSGSESGGNDSARAKAAIAFAAWQGQQLWSGVGERGFRLREMLRVLG
jgi:AcrR family transcriptional regulator